MKLPQPEGPDARWMLEMWENGRQQKEAKKDVKPRCFTAPHENII